MKCKICNKEYTSIRLLASHIAINHKELSLEEYTIKYFYNGERPLCECGCGQHTNYKNLGKFRRFLKGHDTSMRKIAFLNNKRTKEERSEIYYRRYNKDGIWNNPKYLGLFTLVCKQCGQKFEVEASHKDQKFCNKLCYAKWLRIKKAGDITPNYNPRACKTFEQLNLKNKWNLQHEENGGEYCIKELGYWPDAIDFKNKIIIEYDEKRHFNKNGKLRKKDIIRQKEIQNHYPDFKFLRIKQEG